MKADVELFDDVFDPNFCRWLLDDARKSLKSPGKFTRSNQGWSDDIVRSSQLVLVRDYQQPHARFIAAALKERGVIDNLDYNVMCYAWSRLSYIPWHLDTRYSNGVTVYINEQWERDWGGLFLYRTEDTQEPGFQGFVPKFNHALRVNSGVEHSTTLVSVEAPEPRFTVQLFQANSKPDWAVGSD